MKARHMIQRGFTLAEMVIVIVITGIIGAMVAVFLRAPIQGYFDMESRGELTDTADTALRRMGRDLRLALPNSIRTPGAACVEFLPTITGGRYRANGPGNSVNFNGNTTTFDVLGGMPVAPATGDHVVIYNLGIQGANAYAGDNRAQISSIAGGAITLNPAAAFPFESPGNRFHVIPNAERAVFYVCAGGNLYRMANYGFNAAYPAACPVVPVGTPILAQDVNACAFTYTPLVNDRMGLVSMEISLRRNNETVTLYHEVHVSNVP